MVVHCVSSAKGCGFTGWIKASAKCINVNKIYIYIPILSIHLERFLIKKNYISIFSKTSLSFVSLLQNVASQANISYFNI